MLTDTITLYQFIGSWSDIQMPVRVLEWDTPHEEIMTGTIHELFTTNAPMLSRYKVHGARIDLSTGSHVLVVYVASVNW